MKNSERVAQAFSPYWMAKKTSAASSKRKKTSAKTAKKGSSAVASVSRVGGSK